MSDMPRRFPVTVGRMTRLTGLAIVAALVAAAFYWSGLAAAVLVSLSAGIAHLATAFAGVEKTVAEFNRDQLLRRPSEPPTPRC